ncbi:hypothetical protein BDP67DRAFT_485622 [Colletotrichum lupini]|nr:hypothetical protein BDP67DRAFT_485622 [Colletotrichum lupini]
MSKYSKAALRALVARAGISSLVDMCTIENVQNALLSNGTLLGIDLVPSSITTSPVYNTTSGGGIMGGSSTPLTYCNVTVAYTHTSKGDTVNLKYAFPSPDVFKNRFYVTSGGGFSLSSDSTSGISYGAAGGATDTGYDAFNNSYDEVILYGNGSIN